MREFRPPASRALLQPQSLIHVEISCALQQGFAEFLQWTECVPLEGVTRSHPPRGFVLPTIITSYLPH